MNVKKHFRCGECGDEPPVLVADGTTLGLQAKRLMGKGNISLPTKSKKILEAPTYKARMFIKRKR